jgi:hypothetical protein
MKATDDDVRAALRLEPGRRGGDRAACPAPDVLARVAGAAEKPPAEIADHVAGCADCAFEFRLASALKPWAEGAAATLSRPPAPVSRATRWLPVALAASLAVCLGLVAWVVSLWQQGDRLEARLADAGQSREREAGGPAPSPTAPARLEADTGVAAGPLQPQANVALVDLFPHHAARGGSAPAATVDPSRGPLVVLILNVRRPEPGATYAVELVDRGGAQVWAADAVRAGAEPVTLAIPTRLLTGDRYGIRLYRIRNGGRTPAERYDLRVERRPGSTR